MHINGNVIIAKKKSRQINVKNVRIFIAQKYVVQVFIMNGNIVCLVLMKRKDFHDDSIENRCLEYETTVI